ncbi:glycosyltransferase [Solidesulfovibrio sp.]|uniref:glycosyltransferase n=1 Tax=Solidesulfovibrio sp. TaxID=2910990 RepID=UPI00260EFBE8|nr:glycosyltransferase [Solidesulfovibrio sp.]
MELVSIIVPTYNQAKYLPICLDAIWFQEYGDLEIIVVDDGSRDDTREVLEAYRQGVENDMTSFASRYDEAADVVERTRTRRYETRGRTLTVIRHETNKGLSEALNTGVRAATGRLCTFIASDDVLLPGMVRELSQAMRDADADFAYGDQQVIDDDGRILRRFVLPDYSFAACFCDWYFCGVAKLYKRELHDAFGYYDPAYTVQDHDMYLRFAMGGARFVHVPRVLVSVRTHDKDRLVHNHSPEGMSRLYRESSRLVVKAREHLAGPGANPRAGG